MGTVRPVLVNLNRNRFGCVGVRVAVIVIVTVIAVRAVNMDRGWC